ncbi:alpha/beta fold hydrolase [Pseudohalioglobus sediminis]|uniref:Alpha/beta fold hydrolase n=1 Tax=Pseudohalioglobus sediminis TaxID=2606449 RepID=A0A5B0X260_9GAMM|nr:alpha/beta fold hydrolase [Pseudohalioglobus sediminis]
MMRNLLLPVALCGALVTGVVWAQPSTEREQACVVLLHGLFRSAAAMKPLEWYLENEGYATVNESYRSFSTPIEELSEEVVGDGLRVCHSMGFERVHFVAHSMGGILVRQYASMHALPQETRVVMLGPPNQGSQVAEYWSEFDLFGLLETRVLEQLGTGSDSLSRRLGPVTFQLGVIAGNLRNRTLLPGFPDRPSDGTVSVAETVVPGMLDFLEMPVLHTFMIWDTSVMAQAVNFLRSGAFEREGPAGPQRETEAGN